MSLEGDDGKDRNVDEGHTKALWDGGHIMPMSREDKKKKNDALAPW